MERSSDRAPAALLHERYSMMVEPDEPERQLCDQVGCEQVAIRDVLTNYGHLGSVCEDHYAEILEIFQ